MYVGVISGLKVWGRNVGEAGARETFCELHRTEEERAGDVDRQAMEAKHEDVQRLHGRR